MKKSFILLVMINLGLLLTACSRSGTPVVEYETEVNLIEETAVPSAAPTLEPTLSYEIATFTDEMAWIAFDYPLSWSLQEPVQVGERGWQGGVFSPGSSAEALVDGGSRVMITLYSWDPTGDIEAYTAHRKLAWDSSGFTIREENMDFMTDDRAVVTFLVETAENQEAVFAFLTTGDDYLEVSCEGQLDLCREIIGTLRPID